MATQEVREGVELTRTTKKALLIAAQCVVALVLVWAGTDLYFSDARARGAQLSDIEKWVAYYRDLDVQLMDIRLKMVGALGLLMGAWVGYRNLQATQDTLRATHDRLEVDRTSQVTNRYTQAISQLGAELRDGGPNIEVRLGGIYALERIAKDSPPDHWTCMEVLAAYVRENSSKGRPVGEPDEEGNDTQNDDRTSHLLRPDVQAALTVIGRRRIPIAYPEPGKIDLTRVQFPRMSLLGVDLRGADLTGANFAAAFLGGANFSGATLAAAEFSSAQLTDADFESANLAFATLTGADLSDAKLVLANLSPADLSKSVLRSADLAGADLSMANLSWADLSSANLSDSKLKGAWVDKAVNLTPEQIVSAANQGLDAMLSHEQRTLLADYLASLRPVVAATRSQET
jgi:uncharacterized protein YjbI with pentapeptide repeats